MRRGAAPGSVWRSITVAAAIAAALVFTSQSFGGNARVAHASAVTATVTLSDRAFRVNPAILHAGPTVFVVRNTGKKGHAFAVSGPGVKSSHTATLRAGGSAKLTVTLHSGTYMLSDPIGLGAYSVQYVNVVPATAMTGKGDSNVVGSDPTTGAMCGGSYTP
jgi:uncharacterized cupredoxin-like copper-binding protein